MKGASTKDDFDAQMRSFSDAPIVTHVGDRIFADIQRSVIDAPDVSTVYDPTSSPPPRSGAGHTDAIYGLSYDAVGVARKHGGRVYVSGPDSAAPTRSRPINGSRSCEFGGQSRLGEEHRLVDDVARDRPHLSDPQYTWSGLGEVTVNISSLAAEKRTTGGNMLDDSPVCSRGSRGTSPIPSTKRTSKTSRTRARSTPSSCSTNSGVLSETTSMRRSARSTASAGAGTSVGGVGPTEDRFLRAAHLGGGGS